MFLRGAGEQTFSQVNGTMVNFDYNANIALNGNKTPTTYKSGAIGEIQGDGARREISGGDSQFMQVGYNGKKNDVDLPFYSDGGGSWKLVKTDSTNVGGTDALRSLAHYYAFNSSSRIWGDKYDPRQIKFSFNPKHYRYRLNYSTSTDENGNQVIDNISLDEYTSPAEGDEAIDMSFFAADIGWDNALYWPMAGEFRPANIAVKYYIRAK